ncbi:MAG: hypothetical protein Q9M24_00315 [Mariprofundaceae bacterium]|nr:hypothetical protein [Mariprofundaceae bacterium]
MAVRRRRRISTPVIDAQDEYHALIDTWMLHMLLGSVVAFRGFFDMKRGFVDSKVSDKDQRAITTIRNLAPGDFAAVKKRLAILSQDATAETLIAGLKEECAIKGNQPAACIGFAA